MARKRGAAGIRGKFWMTRGEYLRLVRRYAKEKNGKLIWNDAIDQATIIMQVGFEEAARKSMCMLSHKIDPRTYARSEVIVAARRFLEKGGKLHILVERPTKGEALAKNAFIAGLTPRNNFEVRQVRPKIIRRYAYNFAVMDDDSYRFEPDRRASAGIVVFGDQTGANNLKQVFRGIWNESAPISLPESIPRPAADLS